MLAPCEQVLEPFIPVLSTRHCCGQGTACPRRVLFSWRAGTRGPLGKWQIRHESVESVPLPNMASENSSTETSDGRQEALGGGGGGVGAKPIRAIEFQMRFHTREDIYVPCPIHDLMLRL